MSHVSGASLIASYMRQVSHVSESRLTCEEVREVLL